MHEYLTLQNRSTVLTIKLCCNQPPQANCGSLNKLRSLRLNKLTATNPLLLFKSVSFKQHFDIFVQYKHKERLSHINHSSDLFFSYISI